MDRVPQPPPNGDQPQHVAPAPSPVSWQLQQVGTDPEAGTLWVFTIHTVTGPHVTFWTGESLVRMTQMVREQVTDLTIATDLPPDPFL